MVEAEGVVSRESFRGIVSRFIPIEEKNNLDYESLAYAIVKFWKPGFESTLSKNQSVLIDFIRTSQQFKTFEGSKFSAQVSRDLIKNKIVLLGYLGPTDEDKHFTPIRYVKYHYENVPDTYGIVILANEIRTVLKYAK
ncbi:MAG: CHASE2 domain-containing protein [Chitinophagaceae bacterium]|nr:CHASE2 domain-containing protein [Chitinophagaceae bacterium]